MGRMLPNLDMENLRHSTANESEDTKDVLYLPTGYEPKAHDFNELQNSSVPLSFKIPATDQDVDDLTLGEMLTQAYRGQVDYFVQGGVSVSQSSSVMFDGSGQPDGEMVDRSGQPDERNSSKTQIRTLLEEQRQTILAECHARVSHHELRAPQAEEERRLLQGQLWQQKKVLQRWKNYGNFRVLLSILLREENSSMVRTLIWNYQARFRNCKMK